jgi:hypothetical protein
MAKSKPCLTLDEKSSIKIFGQSHRFRPKDDKHMPEKVNRNKLT